MRVGGEGGAISPLLSGQDDHAKRPALGDDTLTLFVTGGYEEVSLEGSDLFVQRRWHPHALEAFRGTAFAEDVYPVGSAAEEHEAPVDLPNALVDLAEERPPWQSDSDG